MSKLKKYTCIREVYALPMTEQEYCESKGWGYTCKETAADGYMTTNTYGDTDWVSKEIFEFNYTEVPEIANAEG